MLTGPILDHRSGVPLYRQVYEHFKQLIRSGRMGPEEKLPPTRELAGMLGLNRTTVTAAYEMLESDGLILRHVGRGSFVAPSADLQRDLDWGTVLSKNGAGISTTFAGAAISFATSRPSGELFPLEAVRACCEEVTRSGDLAAILQLGSPSGYEPLRQRLLATARLEGTAKTSDDLMITSGCQQALDLLARVLLSPEDRVAVEDPVYPGLKNLFEHLGRRLIGLPVGQTGLELEVLERVLKRERPKMLVVTSNFQNPTGATLPLAARHAILRAARQAGVIVVENDIYGELRYAGEPIPALKHIDETGRTVLLRSFSKVTFPGLRVGWVIAPKPLIESLIHAKQLSDLHTDQLSQAVLLRFLESGRFDDHRRRVLRAGAERLSATLRACERFFPAGTVFTRPQGGMNLWVQLPLPLDAGEILPRAQREGVEYLPGRYFSVSRLEAGTLRLSFAGLNPDEIRKGIRILGNIFSKELSGEHRKSLRGPVPALV